ncbi:Chromosome partition protein Smc [Carpediemonas membranifera]|uniref:Chromosome partition protein Smc n=1 Tax=Carpediemonas membranifera TaxID=201153 RepID=A0A8J6ARI3_9EUKA|nr:Chromosome partition protein Smc [Carpediemonas membranifera]|eukprot:KAG9389595.1 Chromosome partition protein Smc [Carpediemonas membranifera]
MTSNSASLPPILLPLAKVLIFESAQALDNLSQTEPDLIAHRDELSKFLGDEVFSMIENQKTLEQRYNDLIQERNQLKGMHNRSRYTESLEHIKEVTDELRTATQALRKALQENPRVSSNLAKIQHERSRLLQLLHDTMTDLDHGTYTAMHVTVSEEKAKNDRYGQMVTHEKEANQRIKDVTAQLEHEKAEYDKGLAQRRDALAKLQTELADTKLKSTVEVTYTRKEAAGRADKRAREDGTAQLDVMKLIEDGRTQLEVEMRVDKTLSDHLEAAVTDLEQQAQEWNERYAKELEEHENQVEEMTKKEKAAAEKLAGLTEDYEREVRDLNRRDEQRAFEARMKLVLDAARVLRQPYSVAEIQRLWKEAARGKAAPAGKGKKGKKGKK